jgi:spermidine synthase
VLVLIPDIGTRYTFFTFAVALLLVSLVGLVTTRSGGGPLPKGKLNRRLLSILLVIPLLFTLTGMRGPIKPPSSGTLLAEHESGYNYIQVVKVGDETQLILNEGVGVHSVYNPHQVLTQGPWDYFMVAPYFNKPPFTPDRVKRVAIIGLGAGTSPREFTAAYGPIPIDGVEIDDSIVTMGRQYFHMNEPNLNVIVQDGRYYLQTTAQKYDIIGMDAYQQPYIPFQLTTTEFFQEVRSHLTPTGAVVINIGRTSSDFRLVNAMAQNMKTIFPNVYMIDSERFSNTLVIGTNAPTSLGNFQTNTRLLTNLTLQNVAYASLYSGHMREEKQAHVYFTDDRAPIEQMIDMVIFNAIERDKY